MKLLRRLFRRGSKQRQPSLWRRFWQFILGETAGDAPPQADEPQPQPEPRQKEAPTETAPEPQTAAPAAPRETEPETAAPPPPSPVPVTPPVSRETGGNHTLRQMPMIPRPDGPPPEDRLGTMPIYTYVGVVFPKANIVYHYRTTDKTITVGDSVLVPVMRRGILKEATGVVVSVGQYLPIGVPYPVSQTKTVIRKL